MSFEIQNLRPFARGDDWTVRFTITDSNNSPRDITGYTYWMTLKRNPDQIDPGDAQRVVAPVGSDATSGVVNITFPATVTGTLVPANYNYDLQQVDNYGNITTLLMGKVRCVRDITRSVD